MTPRSIETAQRPLRRFWKKKEVPVRVTISRYWGIGIHYYATVREENNPIADGRDGATWWTTFSDDVKGRGRVFNKRHGTEAAARSWARRIIAKHFRGQPVAYGHSSGKWHYRGGD